MLVEDCFYLGYFSKVIGTKGELALKLDVDSPASYLDLDGLFIQMFPTVKNLVPFFIKESSLQNNGLLRCALEDVNDQEMAKSLFGKSAFLSLDKLPALGDQQFYFHEISNYEVYDSVKGAIGHVEKVIEYSTSNLLSIIHGEKEILVPITDETIERIDKSAKKIYLNCPEGLIDLYLEN